MKLLRHHRLYRAQGFCESQNSGCCHCRRYNQLGERGLGDFGSGKRPSICEGQRTGPHEGRLSAEHYTLAIVFDIEEMLMTEVVTINLDLR